VSVAGETILIIEDNPLNMELAVDLLEVAGYRVLTASSAEEGLPIAQSELPALILMDIGLPGMDGLEATRALRADERTRTIPIVAVTAHAMKGDEVKALEAGCTGHMTKPLETRTFAQTVASFIDER